MDVVAKYRSDDMEGLPPDWPMPVSGLKRSKRFIRTALERALREHEGTTFLRVAWARCNWEVVVRWMTLHGVQNLRRHSEDWIIARKHFKAVFGDSVTLETQRGVKTGRGRAHQRWLRGIVLLPIPTVLQVHDTLKKKSAAMHPLNTFDRRNLSLHDFLVPGDAMRVQTRTGELCEVRHITSECRRLRGSTDAHPCVGGHGVWARQDIDETINIPVSLPACIRTVSLAVLGTPVIM